MTWHDIFLAWTPGGTTSLVPKFPVNWAFMGICIFFLGGVVEQKWMWILNFQWFPWNLHISACGCLWHVFFSGCKLDFVRFRGCHMFVWTLGYPKFHGQSSCSHIYTHVAIFYGYISFISGQIQRYPKMKYGWICISKDLPMISLLWLVSSPHILEHQPSPVHCFQIWGPT